MIVIQRYQNGKHFGSVSGVFSKYQVEDLVQTLEGEGEHVKVYDTTDYVELPPAFYWTGMPEDQNPLI